MPLGAVVDPKSIIFSLQKNIPASHAGFEDTASGLGGLSGAPAADVGCVGAFAVFHRACERMLLIVVFISMRACVRACARELYR